MEAIMVSQAALNAMNHAGWSIRNFDDSGVKHLLEQRDQSHDLESERATGCGVLFSMAAFVAGCLSTLPPFAIVGVPVALYTGFKGAEGWRTRVKIDSTRKKIFSDAQQLYYFEQVKKGIEKQISDIRKKSPASKLEIVERVERQWQVLERFIDSVSGDLSGNEHFYLRECRASVLRSLSSFKTALKDKTGARVQECKMSVLTKLEQTLKSRDNSDIIGALIKKKSQALNTTKEQMSAWVVYSQSLM
jgi:hypothetical protein